MDKKKIYPSLNWMRLFVSIFPLLVHSNVYDFGDSPVGLLLNVLTRNCVLIVFGFCTGFFGFRGLDLAESKSDRAKIFGRLKKTVVQYALWFAVYIPLMLYGELTLYGSSLLKAFAKIGKSFLFLGWHYEAWHMWYMHALIVAMVLMIVCLRFRLSARKILFLSALAYVCGVGLHILQENGNALAEAYFQFFYDTRYGMFWIWFFVSYGYWSSQRGELRKIPILVLMALQLLVAAACIAFSPPVCYDIFGAIIGCLMIEILIRLPVPEKYPGTKAAELGKVVYFIHMFPVALFELVLRKDAPQPDYITFIGATALAYPMAALLIRWKQTKSGRWLRHMI